MNLNFKFADNTMYNPYNEVHVIFYNKHHDNSNSPKFLLHKTHSDTHFQELHGSKTSYEPSVLFTATRLIVNKFNGIFSLPTLLNLANGLPPDNSTLHKHELHWLEQWTDDQYNAWLRVLINNPIQYDEIQEKLVLFVEIPDISLDILNTFAENEKLDFQFKWFDIGEIWESDTVSPSLQALEEVVGFSSHIKRASSNKEKDLFIILTCKSLHREFDRHNLHLPAIINGLYKRNNEEWLHFNSAERHFPSPKQLLKAKALILPGSASSVYVEEDWIKRTLEWVAEFDTKYHKTKVLGLCFGAQLLCATFGGKVEKMENMHPEKHKKGSFICGNEKIRIKKEFFDLSFVKKSGVKCIDTFTVIESHGDKITSLSDKFMCYGDSKYCEVEVFVSKCGRYFALQGHPEYGAGYMSARKAALKAKKKNKKTAEEIEELMLKAWHKSYVDKLSEYELRSVCYHFLKEDVDEGSEAESSDSEIFEAVPDSTAAF